MTNEEAIEILNNFFINLVFPRCNGKIFTQLRVEQAMVMALEALKEESRKTAKWIPVQLGDCKCSLCGETYGIIGSLLGSYNYCPNCGAEMEKENDNR